MSDPRPRRGPPRPAGTETRDRIVDAAIRCLVREGIAGASIATIAAAANVSKALIHYHFGDRTRLLTTVAVELTTRTVARERAAVDGALGSRALDALWEWVTGELERGELHALLELGTGHDAQVVAAAADGRAHRRRAATRTVERLFGQLGLTPRVPPALLGTASVTFIDGLMSGTAAGVDARVAFDVFWLALLGLVA